jgi:hypothetical protein
MYTPFQGEVVELVLWFPLDRVEEVHVVYSFGLASYYWQRQNQENFET